MLCFWGWSNDPLIGYLAIPIAFLLGLVGLEDLLEPIRKVTVTVLEAISQQILGAVRRALNVKDNDNEDDKPDA